jgi:hypothetical protein
MCNAAATRTTVVATTETAAGAEASSARGLCARTSGHPPTSNAATAWLCLATVITLVQCGNIAYPSLHRLTLAGCSAASNQRLWCSSGNERATLPGAENGVVAVLQNCAEATWAARDSVMLTVAEFHCIGSASWSAEPMTDSKSAGRTMLIQICRCTHSSLWDSMEDVRVKLPALLLEVPALSLAWLSRRGLPSASSPQPSRNVLSRHIFCAQVPGAFSKTHGSCFSETLPQSM